jgi:5-methylcytosine-specific restriction endonuclease McrA
MNRWNIPDCLELEVRARDLRCIYCGVEMLKRPSADAQRARVATWEHIINDARIITRENIALCCTACNASKGTKRLGEWLESTYCKSRGITADTVARVAAAALDAETNGDAP